VAENFPRMTPGQASGYAILVFVCTLILSFLLPDYLIILSGLLVVIFLSFFVRKESSTIIAGLGSALIVGFHMIFQLSHNFTWERLSEYFFLLVLIFVASFIVLYIKNLVLRMELDKSHITSLFENATEGFVVTNSKGSIVLVNPSACRMFGYEQDELVGQAIEILIPRQYKVGHVKMRDGFYENPQNRVMGHGRDLHGEKKGGSTFPVEVSLSTYMQKAERFVIAFIVDITHRKEIEKNIVSQQQQLERVTNEMRQLNAELEAKVEERTVILKEALQRLEQSQDELSEALDKERQLNEIKSRFVAMASHEFRTPLSTVLSSASLLSKYVTTEDQEKRNRHITKIKGSVKHLNDLLEDFLSLGKLDEGKVGAVFNEFNLPELFTDVIEEMKGLVKHGQHILYSHSGEELIDSDKKLFRNIMINLVSNAIKFSDPDKNIVVASSINSQMAECSVTDEGIGISEEDKEHLFSSFFRGKNAINIQGTGLGLHIVKRYLDLLGGSISLNSELGKGTTITFTIPVKQN
jgi:PAS domain S-box-containing protein